MHAALLDKSLIYVTGKGGVGKTTVAIALGITAAGLGKRTVVCEVADQSRVSRVFHREGVRDEGEVQLADNLWAVSIDQRSALEDWLVGQLRNAGLVRTLTRSSAFQHFVAAAPGAKELMTIARIWEMSQAERWDRKSRTYDVVIVDAPASGHGVAMLQTPQTFGDIARVGPIRRQATKIRGMLADPQRTAYVAVALGEEMPVNETLDLEARLADVVGMGLHTVIVNALYPQRFDEAEAERLRALAATDGHDPQAAAAIETALGEHDRALAQREHVRRLDSHTDARVVTLPFLFEPELGLDDYRRLGEDLDAALGA